MAFNFGGSGQGPFDSTNKQPAQGSLFGNPSTAGGGFQFGKPAATTGAEGQSTAATSTENKSASPGIFGQQSGASGQNPFGSNKSDSSEGFKPAFGGFDTPDKSSTPSTTSAPPLFGSTTPATTNPFSFGTSTTPAGPPPASSAFGASTGGTGTGLFGSKPAEVHFKPAEPSSSAFNFGGKPGGFPFKPAEPRSPAFNFGGKPGEAPFKPAESISSAAPSVTSTSSSEQKSFSFPASTPATTSAPGTSQSAATSLFGATPKPFEGQKLFGKPATTDAPKSPFGFPQPGTTPASGTFIPATSAPTPKPLFSGMGGLGSSIPTSTTAPATAASSSTTASPFSFPTATTSQPATTSAPAASPFSFPTATTSQPATTSAPAPSPFGFGKAATPATSQPATMAVAPGSAPFSGFGTTPTSQPAITTTAPAAGTAAVPGSTPFQASTTGPAPPAQSQLRNKTMDEILTRWATDMSRYSKEFKDHAEIIARWDQLIVDNSSKIDKLYVRTRTCERQTVSVDMQLTAVENSQSELESWLTKYENDVDEMLAKDSSTPSELGGPDQERERTYKLAEKLSERLEEMERDLGSMVEEVNAANASLSRNGKGDEPITQIVKILNSHLIQLQTIDQGTQALQEKVAAAQKAASHLGYLNGSALNGNGGAAVQDFYRSYMGRRS